MHIIQHSYRYNYVGLNKEQSNGQTKISVNTINYAEGLYLISVQGNKVQQEYKVRIKH
jgi:hypothetical protein